MKRRITTLGHVPALAVLLLSSACAGMGAWEEVLGGLAGMNTGEVRGEVDHVDTRDREIQLRTSFGQLTRARYDSRTEVVSGQRRYSVRDLERGDRVSMYLLRDRRGELYAERIHLEERGGRRRDDREAERRDGVGRVGERERLEGRIGRIDSRSGRFELDDRRHGTVLVTLPDDPSRATRDRFRRLHRGDAVRIEALVTGRRQVRLVRFLR